MGTRVGSTEINSDMIARFGKILGHWKLDTQEAFLYCSFEHPLYFTSLPSHTEKAARTAPNAMENTRLYQAALGPLKSLHSVKKTCRARKDF